MICPKCHHPDTKVIDSRPEREGRSIRRRRECEKCNFRFSTVEKVSTGNLIVIKRDGTEEKFSPEKLEASIMIACGKRPISRDRVREVVSDLSETWASHNEVSSEEIGATVMAALKDLDHIAYIRFASVYRQFKDIDEFKREITGLFDKK